MLFFRQTLLSVCLILCCSFAFAQPQAEDDDLGEIDEDSGPTPYVNILSNDDAGAGFSLDAASVDLDISTPGTYDASITTVGGVFTYNLANSVTFAPAPNYYGLITVDYTVETTEPQSLAAKINIMVKAVNDAPTITAPINQTINEDESSLPLQVTIADIDDDPNILILTGASNTQAIIKDAGLSFGNAGGVHTITVMPEPNANGGPVMITLEVDDGDETAEATFNVSVTAVNDAPTITAPVDQTIIEDATSAALNVIIADVDDAPGTLSLTGSSGTPAIIENTGLSFGNVGGVHTVTVAPKANAYGGPVSITLEADDGDATAQASFNVNVTPVNDAPTINGPGAQIINEDGTIAGLAVTLTDVDDNLNDLVLTGISNNLLVVPNAGITFGGNAGARNVTVAPAADANGGPVGITLEVSDGELADQTSFDVTVNAVNDAPTLLLPAPQSINENTATPALPITISDIDSDVSAITLSGTSDDDTIIPDANVVFNGAGGNRTVTVTPATNQSGGPVMIGVTANDGIASTSDDFTVTVNAVDAPPTIGTIANQTIPEDGATAAIDFTIDDPDGLGGLVLSATSSNTTLIPNANIVFGGVGGTRNVTVTPVANLSGGPVTITVELTDGTDVASTTFTVTVTAVNDVPTIVGPGPQSINENTSTAALGITVGDVETAAGSLVLSGVSSNLTLIPNGNIIFGGAGASRTVTVTPAANQSGGPVTITLTVSDGVATNTTNFTVTVGAVNDPPTIGTIANQTIPEDGATAAINFTIGDPDGLGGLVLSATSSNTTLIPNANILFGGAGATRNVTVTPVANLSGGPVTITVELTDGTNITSTTFTVTVTAVNDVPTIAGPGPQSINENTSTAALGVTVGDLETAAGSLILTGVSSNLTLIPNGNIVFGGAGASRTVTVTPVANQSGGPVTITLTVSDGVATNTTNFTVTVGAVNDPPTIGTIANQTIPEDGATAAINFTIGDPDGLGGLVVSAISSNTTLIPNANILFGGAGATRNVTVTPVANLSGGPVTVTVELTDGTNITSTTFTVTVTAVNDVPTIAGPGPQSINENTSTAALGVTVGDLETAAGSLILTGVSSNLTLIPNGNIVFGGAGASRTVTVTPAANQSGGPVTITLTVSDGVATNTTNFTVSIGAVNDPPTIGTIANQTIPEDGATAAINFTVGDPDGLGGLVLSATSGNTTLIPNANILFGGAGASRNVTVTPVANLSGGPVTITVELTDGTNVTSTTFTVTVTAVNDVPTIAGPGPQSINENTSTAALGVTVGDVETAAGSLILTGISSNLTLIPNANIVFGGAGASRTVTVTPAASQNGGPVTITLTVSDGVATNTTNFTVTVGAVNDPPTIGTIANQTIPEDGATPTINFTIGDPDGLTGLVLSATSSNVSLIPNANIVLGGAGVNRTISASPAANQNGTSVITVDLTDGVNTVSTTFQVTVSAIDDAPTITSISNQTTNEDVATSLLAFTVGDAETAPASLVVTGSSDNISLVPNANIVIAGPAAARTVQVTPVANQSGVAVITLTVSDGVNSTVTNFQITVNTVNDLPTITAIADQSITEDAATAALPFTVGDVETAAGSLVVTGTSGNAALIPNANIVFTGGGTANRTVQVTPLVNQSGNAVITVNVSDGVNTTSTTFQVTVSSVNDPATITAIADRTINEDNATAALPFTVGDTETAVTALTVTGASSNTVLVPNANITFGGSGAARTVTITPAANQSGVANITVTVNDGTNDTPISFQVTVSPINDAPVITAQTPVATSEEQPFNILFTHITVNDPDDTYPADFTLTVIANSGYTFSGNTVTPNANVSGILPVSVQVSDGTALSNIYNVQVTVNAVNDPPVVTAQNPSPMLVNEDGTVAVLLSNLTIVDPDNVSGFTLSLTDGTNYSVSGNVVTPDANYNGTLTVPVTVSDGSSPSAPFNLQIQVNPVNDVPQINGQVPISIAEVQPVAIDLSQVIVFDPDNTYPTDFTIDILSGANYSITGNTVIPVPNFSGTLLVRVFVNDGIANSAIYNLQILVNSTNDPPVIIGQTPLSTNEGQPIDINFGNLSVTDPDNTYPTGFTLTILPGTSYTFSGNTVTPNPNVEGMLSVAVKVNDGSVDSAPYNVQINVIGVNNAPVITGQQPVSTGEEQSITLRLADLLVTDPDSPFPSGFTLTVSSGTNYVLEAGNTIKPVANFTGTLSVPVTVNDGQLTSNSYSLLVTVGAFNDPPQITGQNTLATLEDQPIILKLADFMVTDVDNTFPTGFTLNVLPPTSTTYTVTGVTVTPALNFTGTLSVAVRVNDGAANSELFNAQITVAPVNDAPTLAAISNVTIQEDPLEATLISLSSITSGAGEASQTLTVTASNNQPDWFETFQIQYTAGETGTLSVKPKPNKFGTAQITVRIEDNGAGSPAPNVNFFERTFDFIIEPINDAPVFISVPVTLAEPGLPYLYIIIAEDEEEQAITFNTSALPDWLTLAQDANGSATLSGIPPPGSTGQVAVILQVKDPSASPITNQEFTINVNSRPVISPFTITTNEDIAHIFNTEFANGFTDADANPLTVIQITRLPINGTLRLGDNTVTLNQEIPAAQINSLKYLPFLDITGKDTIKWNGSDGLYYSNAPVNIAITINPVNDLPEIIAIEAPETDTLKYELGSERPVQLTKIFDARDVDGDDLLSAEIGFSTPAIDYYEMEDQFLFRDTLGITGDFDETFGILTLTGKASVQNYVAAIRAIKYNLVDAINADGLEVGRNRLVSIKLSDRLINQAHVFGGTKERLVGLISTFLELDIASAFTPTGANPVWNIYSPNGLEQYKDALIRVYNKRGTIVYEAKGFNVPWNGDGPEGALPADSYFYTIDLKYDKKKYKGVVTILR